MKAVVCTPWIETDSYWRERGRTWTAAYWWNLGMEVVYGTAKGVNRAAARNDAARRTDADVFFFSDADMWVPESQMKAAIEKASQGTMVMAYVQHMRLNRWATTRIVDGLEPTMQGQTVKDCAGGCFAVHRDVYETVGGHDERFTVWGGEDRSFYFACQTLVGPIERIDGFSYHLWHTRDPVLSRHTDERKAGTKLALRYKRAAGIKGRTGVLPATRDAKADPDAMRAILQEPGGPLHDAVPSAHG